MQRNDTLPPGFQFSQSSLQDFVDCPRRFQLRYIWELSWPALQTEPALENERFLRRGAIFHHMVHQHMLGIPEERLAMMIAEYVARDIRGEQDLLRWWDNYLAWKVGAEDVIKYPETSLSAPQGEYRLVAKYDLIVVSDQYHFTIVDWKTSRKRPNSRWLKERLQTKIYPYLLVSVGSHLANGLEIEPDKVEMIYWFTEFPQEPERFVYDPEFFSKDQAYLSALIAEIAGLGTDTFPLTSKIKRCDYCIYRSFCNRGIHAGNLYEGDESQETDIDIDVILDFEQIEEIEY
jgi:CRISPR/Cas system-associated exonuclease Cas4 (RecB family)